MSASAATVVDLQEFRARRMCAAARTPEARAVPRPAPLAPFWVYWVAVWPIAR